MMKKFLEDRQSIQKQIITNLINAGNILPSEADKYSSNVLQKLNQKDLLAVLDESRVLLKQSNEIGRLVVDKALGKVRIDAQDRARAFLCYECLDKRCLTGSICKAFIQITDSIAWEIMAERAELNWRN